MTKACYISHPIAGKTEAEKVEAEAQGTNWARWGLGMVAVLPRQIAAACGRLPGPGADDLCGIPGRYIKSDDHTVQCYMRGDIAEMLKCDAILVMPGWEASAGCRDEIMVAAMCGLPIHFYRER